MNLDLKYEYRTGIGTDIHKLIVGRDLKLGGILIPFDKGLLGHSDGDALLHAVVDALLGAAGLGDIGSFFPDHDPQYADADSRDLLMTASQYLEDKRWEIVNLDLIVHAEQPKLEPFKAQMKRAIASILSIDFNAVNVKAKTNEGLDAVGRGEAIAATAMVLLRRRLKRTL
ncbi:MAG: 2-C-methyl-D-erythritol 2,4-cyclodiphosphate synthase [Sedimentisphaerales bacterium]|nr:2-C-methyl-D-erythritol 2,4-cyclodiphosphate synthase [Sedimentisphaerales bacterium]